MNDLRQAAQAVVDRWDSPNWKDAPATAVLIMGLRAALSEPEPKAEPVAWRYVPSDVWGLAVFTQDPDEAAAALEYGRDVEPLYAHPPAGRRPMTEGEARAMWHAWAKDRDTGPTELIRAVERHHGITGGSDDGGGA